MPNGLARKIGVGNRPRSGSRDVPYQLGNKRPEDVMSRTCSHEDWASYYRAHRLAKHVQA